MHNHSEQVPKRNENPDASPNDGVSHVSGDIGASAGARARQVGRATRHAALVGICGRRRVSGATPTRGAAGSGKECPSQGSTPARWETDKS